MIICLRKDVNGGLKVSLYMSGLLLKLKRPTLLYSVRFLKYPKLGGVMSVKLAVTICDYGATVYVGGDNQRNTYIVEIENERLETLLTEPKDKDYFTVSLSVVRD